MSHTTRTQTGVRQKGLYKNLYQQIDLSSPGYDDMPAQSGGSMAQQARAAGYQDIYRNIQAMRDAEYKKELKEGEMTPEFSGFSGRGQHTVRSQADVRQAGLYNHLNPRTGPVKHPYLPRTVTNPYRRSGLGSLFGQAAEKTGPGLVVALVLLIGYLVFIRKPAEAEEPEIEEEEIFEEELEPISSRYNF